MPIGAILGGLISGGASLFGSSQIAGAANQATQLQQQEFQTIQQQLAPFLNTGTNANQLLAMLFGVPGTAGATATPGQGMFWNPISSIVGAPPSPTDASLQSQFLASPGYQYQLGQMNNATQNLLGKTGGAVNGNMLRALQGNAQGLASQDWGNFYNNLVQNYGSRYGDVQNQRNQILAVLQNLAAAGQGAAAQTGQFGMQSVTNQGNFGLQGAIAGATGLQGGANSLTNLLNNPSVNSSLNYLVSGGANYAPPTDYGSQFVIGGSPTTGYDFAGGGSY